MNKKIVFIVLGLIILIGTTTTARAKIDLVTLPSAGETELTIYKSANLTLVKETRTLTLNRGTNRLQFDWSQTRIDPTSVRLTINDGNGEYRVKELAYPANTRNTLVWEIDADQAADVPVTISYFTLGINWEAFYQADLSQRETTMDLRGYVKINNGSGESFEKAHVRLLLGKVNILENLAQVIREWRKKREEQPRRPQREGAESISLSSARRLMADKAGKRKEITTEGVSEYYLMSIEGRDRLKDGESKRLQFLRADGIPVENYYRYWPGQGQGVQRGLRFENKKKIGLGRKPLPSGTFQVVRRGTRELYQWIGAPNMAYLAMGEKARVWLGRARQVRVEPVTMDRYSDHYKFDDEGNITGWDEYEERRTTVSNFRRIPVTLELYRPFEDRYWSVIESSHPYHKDAYDRIKMSFELDPGQQIEVEQTLQFPRGTLRK